MMTQTEAWKLIQYYYDNGRREEDKSSFHETCRYLMETYDDMDAVIASGGDYYSDKDYQKAFQDYALAAEHDVPYGYIGLGYIWYYGRTGKTDYQKAYECFTQAIVLITGEKWKVNALPDATLLENDEEYDDLINAVYKVADMYEHGYYVEKSYSVFSSLIHELYDMMQDPSVSDHYMPEIEYRMAEITLHDNPAEKEQVLRYLSDARSRMVIRLEGDSFFGDFDVMKEIVMKVCDLTSFDADEMDLYDLWYVMQKPCTVTFFCNKQKYELTRKKDGTVHDRNNTYASVDEWLQNAEINNHAVTFMNDDCYDFSIHAEEKE